MAATSRARKPRVSSARVLSRWLAGRLARVAALGLVLVLVLVSAYVLWASVYTATVTEHALETSQLSSDYEAASRAVATEESLERKYRLEPGPDVLARFDAAAAELVQALGRVRIDGDATDAAEANDVLTAHAPYLRAIKELFVAVDRGDEAAVLIIDGERVDPLFISIQATTDSAAQAHKELSVSALDVLRRVERFTSTVTPLVFIIGLALVVAFTSVLRRVRKQLDGQRERAMHHSLHDALTGLPNRMLLADRFDRALDAGLRSHRTTGLLLIDLDRFKEVNDTLGHHIGDGLLALIGPRLATVLRDGDTIARLGGDEFAVLLPEVEGLAGAITIAENLNVALSEPFTVEGIDLAVEASIGVVVSGIHGSDATSLFQHADVAMYIAKEQGLGLFGYRPDLDVHSPERLALLGDLRHALDADEFVLNYQPQVSLTTGEFTGAESLVRWQHPTRGLIMPNDFIPLIEHTALVGPFTRRMLELALTQIRLWLDSGFRIPVAVNVSARNLVDDRFVADVFDLLDVHGVPPDMLGLEVTESAMMTEPSWALRTLVRLHERGIRISVDDFGAGYTSLGELKNLPVSELKIDYSFVLSMDTDVGNALIVRSVIELGHNLGLTVVAEGVETETVLGMLSADGCDIAQGFLLSHPVPPGELLDYYTKEHKLGLTPPRTPLGT